MKVQLLHSTPIEVVIVAIRTCYDSMENSDSHYQYEMFCSENKFIIGEKDKQLIKRIIKKGHTSTLEHLNYTFDIDGISRACSHQLVRHRIASYSQQSQRYVKTNRAFVVPKTVAENDKVLDAYKNIIDTIDDFYNLFIENGIAKEDARYLLPNSTTTKLIMTINARSLINFFELRLDKSAQWEIRELAFRMYEEIPAEHKFIFEEIKKKVLADVKK